MVFDKQMFDYAGAIHIHTKYSFDGNTEVMDIVQSAKKNGIKFIFVTDHGRLDALKQGWEGWHDGVLVVVGEEISPRYNHYLAFDIKEPVTVDRGHDNPQEYIDSVNVQGGFGFIAHPDHKGTKEFGVKDYPWLDWSVKGYLGISIWDLMTDWQENLTSLPKTILSYMIPTWVLKGPKQATLARWDELNQKQKVCGYGEIDNHNSIRKYFGMAFRIFPFDYALSTIRTHVVLNDKLSGELLTAKKQIYTAIKYYSSYVCQERWNKADGFIFSVSNEEKRVNYSGEISLRKKEGKLEVALPQKAKLRIIQNGRVIKEKKTNKIVITINTPGVYRVEVLQKKYGFYKPWIYSNPIWVK